MQIKHMKNSNSNRWVIQLEDGRTYSCHYHDGFVAEAYSWPGPGRHRRYTRPRCDKMLDLFQSAIESFPAP